jgi:hypothetical protein
MNVVSNIAAAATDAGDRPLVDVVITNVFITRNGTNALNFAVTNQFLPEVQALPMSITNTNGIKISTGTATSSYQYVYNSTNLHDWSEAASKYWPEASGEWSFAISGEPKEFFHANRVVYTPDTNMTADIANHHLVVTVGSSVVQITTGTNNTGVVKYGSYPEDHIVAWEWIKEEPYQTALFVETDYPDAYYIFLHYSTPSAGRCKGYYSSGSGWYYLEGDGNGTFTDQNLN